MSSTIPSSDVVCRRRRPFFAPSTTQAEAILGAEILIHAIARVRSPFGEKFGIPRQAGLAPSAHGEVVLLPPYDDPAMLDGLAGFGGTAQEQPERSQCRGADRVEVELCSTRHQALVVPEHLPPGGRVALEVHGERMIKRTFDPGFRIALHQKDLNLALSGARALGISERTLYRKLKEAEQEEEQ